MEWYFSFVGGIQATLQFYFLGRFTGCKATVWQYALYVAFFFIADSIITLSESFLLPIFFNVCILYAAGRLLLHKDRTLSVLTAILDIAIMQLSYGILNGLVFLLAPHMDTGSGILFFVGILAPILSMLLSFCCYQLILRNFSIERDAANQYIFMILTPMLLLSVMNFYIVNTVYGNVIVIPYPAEPDKHLPLILLQILGLCVIFSTLYAYQKLYEGFQARAKLALLEQEAHAQKTYVTEARTRYEQTRSFRHDIKNHLSVVDGLLKAGQIEQAQTYLEKLESVTGELSFPVQTGNPVLDILISSKLELADENGIKADCALTLPQTCKVDDFDLCVLFSNALDNAIKACMQADETRYIRIAGQRQGDFYLLGFENTCQAEQAAALEVGTGLSNIRTVAEKYSGTVTIDVQSGRFSLDILLNIL